MIKREELELRYDQLCEEAQVILDEYDPCETEARETCRIEIFSDRPSTGEWYCCARCEHLSPKGCTVKALGCMVWLCSHVDRNNDAYRKLLILGLQARREHLCYNRASKEQSIIQAMYYVNKGK